MMMMMTISMMMAQRCDCAHLQQPCACGRGIEIEVAHTIVLRVEPVLLIHEESPLGRVIHEVIPESLLCRPCEVLEAGAFAGFLNDKIVAEDDDRITRTNEQTSSR